jgi:hypothetical protein
MNYRDPRISPEEGLNIEGLLDKGDLVGAAVASGECKPIADTYAEVHTDVREMTTKILVGLEDTEGQRYHAAIMVPNNSFQGEDALSKGLQEIMTRILRDFYIIKKEK